MNSTPQTSPGQGSPPRRLSGLVRLLVLMLFVVAAASLLAWWQPWKTGRPALTPGLPAPDPRLTFETRFRNVRPDVAYVGDARCVECHVQAVTYPNHPMGRSFMPIHLAVNSERFDETVKNPFERFGDEYRIERRGGEIVHTVRHLGPDGGEVYHVENPVEYAMGSATRGRSYLVNHDGFLYESPISWFTQGKRWDVSPGYPRDRLFDRPIRPQCVFCHCNDARPVEGTLNKYEQPLFQAHAIGCERCHGPAELHIKEREYGQKVQLPDDTIVNPGRLPPALRDSVCEQCHLQGEGRITRRGRGVFDYRPGLPLHLFLSVFVRPPEQASGYRVVGQVEQMRVSQCYQKSAGRLGCISCHDPHLLPAPEQRVAYYRDRCMACHGTSHSAPPPPSACKEGGDDNCMRCHMPRLHQTDIAHTAATDHRILRPGKPGPGTPGAARRPAPGQMPWVYYYADQVDPHDPEVTRDLGIALMEQTFKRDQQEAHQLADLAVPRLKEAVQRDPADLNAWEALGMAYNYQGHPREALEAYESVLTRMPSHESALVGAGECAMSLNQLDAVQNYCERAVAAYPWTADYRSRLAYVRSRREDWAGARDECRAALRINPALFEVRKLLVTCLLHAGDRAEAEKEYQKARGAFPEQAGELRRVWEGQRR